MFNEIGCKAQNPEKNKRITIVDIGFNDRIQLGKQLRTIRQYSPRIVGLDFHLYVDSLEKDSILVKEMKVAKIIQVLNLKEYNETTGSWERIEQSHSKFKATEYGFANVNAYEDRVAADVFNLQQTCNNRTTNAFSLEIANHSYGVKDYYKSPENKEFPLDLDDIKRNYTRISNEDLQRGNFKRSDIEGKIVILGYLGTKQDFFYLTEDKRVIINGVEIHAAILNEILAEP